MRLEPTLVNTKRIKILIYLESPKLIEKYYEAIENAQKDFSRSINKHDDNICFVFMDLFSHNKLILEYLLRRISVLDIKLLKNYKRDKAYKWFDAPHSIQFVLVTNFIITPSVVNNIYG